MKNKIIYIVCAIMIFISIYEIKNTYGLFESKKEIDIDKSVAKWNIYINDNNLNTTETFTIDNFTFQETDTVAKDKIAPGILGWFDILIDARDTQVSIIYEITFDFTSLPSNITVEKIEEINGREIIKTGPNTYSNYITLDDINNNVKDTIRVYIKWNNDEENNENDTNIGIIKNNSIKIPVSITVSQYLNDTIEPYNEQENE
ncbi:MAG: hypothetical protein SO067_06860 [Bacilli bacterium]|jgi:hypothetical protein|nr:hypothetical protein [Clostridium sp.]MDY3798815.1 hypothetical protein [Bacilli bacterium]